MKYIFSQMAVFLSEESNKRNIRFVLRFSMFMVLLIALYSTAFHYIMLYEGRSFSPVTGFYWTMTVMSTLGFGDITFNSDLGRMFTVLVLLSGILFFMLILPFSFIRFVYQPWLDAQSKHMVPTSLPPDTSGHVVLIGTDDLALNIYNRLTAYDLHCHLLTPDMQEAVSLFEQGRNVLQGEIDSADTYRALRADKAAMFIALQDDFKNTNIAATMREVAPHTKLVSCAQDPNAEDILKLAGYDHVFNFTQLLGASMGNRVFAGNMECNIIGRFEDLCLAEAQAEDTPMVGKSLVELDLRGKLALNVVGVWEGSRFMSTTPQTVVGSHSVLLLAGSEDRLEAFDRYARSSGKSTHKDPTLVIGAGKVGSALVQTLQKRGLPYRIVESRASLLDADNPDHILGNAEDITVLRKAGIADAHSMAITTHNDDLNIYLTVYCRKLRPDMQIISRCNLSRNIESMYVAGASLVMAPSSMASNAMVNLLSPERIYTLTEGVNIFRVNVPRQLAGKNLRESNIRQATGCNVLAVRHSNSMTVTLDPDAPFANDDELIIVGTSESEHRFHGIFSVG